MGSQYVSLFEIFGHSRSSNDVSLDFSHIANCVYFFDVHAVYFLKILL